VTLNAGIAPVIRFAALAFAVLAVCFAAAELDREEPTLAVPAATASEAADPVAAELARCRAISDPAQVDDACRRAWAERRARFFSQPEARP
jgi:conjugative transfer region protein TrbK